MADDPTPVDDAPEDGDDGDETPAAKGDEQLGEAGRRALEAERRARREAEAKLKARLKELEPLAAKAKELEDAGRSDVEKLTADLQEHQSRASKAESELMRLRVAMRKGLTETQARRLVGSSEEELEEDADDLLASFRPAQSDPAAEAEAEPERDPNPRRRPQERLRPGAVPDADTEPVETDPRKLAAAIRRDVF